MLSIRYNLDSFIFDKKINHSKEEYNQLARTITSYIRETLQDTKHLLNKTITQSAAFVVLEENMSEFVRNSIDAFKHSDKNDWSIIIKIPISSDKNQQTTLIYLDTAGGFPKEFFKDKEYIDYYYDMLPNNKISIESKKILNEDQGGSGIALSQTSRFLHNHAGSLKLDNTPNGARLQITSPISAEGSPKPSFNRFREIDTQNLLAEIDRKAEKRMAEVASEEKVELLKVPQNNGVNERAKKLGITPLKLPCVNCTRPRGP